jgi:phospholipid/cholesterol/gamma-HCH transport system substrate-binding protein
MQKETSQLIRTGILVASGTVFLIVLLYLVGKNENLFGSGFALRARFTHVQGLKEGNNVRYAGIDLGTVRSIRLLNDSMVEVDMRMNRKLRGVLLKNSMVSIGTDGLVGNKVINIAHGHAPSELAENGTLLPTVKPVDTDKMLNTLYNSNQSLNLIFHHIEQITAELKSASGWKKWASDTTIQGKINATAATLEQTSTRMLKSSELVYNVLSDVHNRKGMLGKLISDTSWANQTEVLIHNLENSITSFQQGIDQTNQSIEQLSSSIQSGKGTVSMLLKDTMVASDLQATIKHLQQSSQLLEENLKALQHNIFFRGYFRKQNKLMITVKPDVDH